MNWKKSALIHAKETNTEEVCGLICIVKGREKYWPCENIADDPTDGFCLSPDDWMKAEDAGELVGVFHSHPFTSPKPSQVDLSSCEHLGLPFYIVNPHTEQWHDFKPTGYIAPLIGRQWTWGASDCWKLVIDYFAGKGLTVKDWKRPKKSGNRLWRMIGDLIKKDHGYEIKFPPRPIERIEVRKSYVAAYDIFHRAKKWK